MENIVRINVDDTSPTVSYFPFGDTLSTPNLTAGWNPYYNISGFNNFVGQVGQGASMHITSLDGASLSVSFSGTGIQLFGNATQAKFSVEVDGAPPDPQTQSPALPDNVLIAISNLTNTNHTLSLIAHISGDSTDPPQSMLVFGGATFLTPPPVDTTENSFSLQNLTDSNVNFLGQWSFHTDQNNQSFRQSNTAGDKAQSSFLGTAFLIHGRTAPDAGSYSVLLDGTLRHFSAESSFVQNNSLLFYASGLDPTVVHQWEVTNEGGSTLTIPVGGFSAFADGDPNPTSTPVTSSTLTYSKGTIAALVLAGVLAFIFISGSLFFFLVYRPHRRRMRQQRHERRERRKKAQEAGLVLDISHDAFRQDVIPDSRRTSRRTGFARWKHEVEGGALGLSDIGLSFRHSEEKADSDELEDEDAPKSAKSFRFTPSPKLKSRWFGGRERHKKEHSSPSIALELPPIYPRSRSRSDSRSPGQDASSGLTSLSYLSSPSNNSVRLTTFHSQSASPALHRHPDIQFTPPRTQEPDLRSAYTLESDLGSVREYDDGLSVLGPATAQAAIRGLSPRTSEMGSRSGSQASQQLPIWQSPSSSQQERRSPPLDTRVETGNFLDVRAGSPETSGRPRRLSSLSHVRFEDADSEPVKGRPQGELKVPPRSTFRLTPLSAPPPPNTEGTRSGVTSFLDFSAGSSENSIVDHSREGTQSSGGSFTNQPKSRWSSTTVPSSMVQEGVAKPETGSSGDSQSQSFLSVASSSPLSFPFPVSLPASPHHPEGHRPSPPSTSHVFPESQSGDPTSHPTAAFAMESPTESVPISISDLHFRQSDSEDSDPSSSSHLPRHPPLPNLAESTHESEDDLVTPTFVVARVLGMATPSAATFTHTRLGSTSTAALHRVPSDSQRQQRSGRHPPDS